MTPSLIIAITLSGFIEFRKKILFALQAAKTLARAATIVGSRSAPGPRTPSDSAMSLGTPLRETDARNFQIFLRVGQRVLVFQLHAQQQLAIGIERPGVGFIEILFLRHTPDLRRRRRAVNAAASLVDSLIQPLFVNG